MSQYKFTPTSEKISQKSTLLKVGHLPKSNAANYYNFYFALLILSTTAPKELAINIYSHSKTVCNIWTFTDYQPSGTWN